MNSELIKKIETSSQFSKIDVHFARLVHRIDNRNSPEVYLAAALVSYVTRQKHICLDLKSTAGKPVFEDETDNNLILCPDLDSWLNELKKSRIVGSPGDFKPLILDNKLRLYLYRYWEYESKLAEFIKNRTTKDFNNTDFEILGNGLSRHFSAGENDNINWQKVAAFIATVKGLCIITGGPGTGKTTVLAKIMAILLDQDNSLRIVLTAPTGKACMRIRESLRQAKQIISCPDQLKEKIPEQAVTIHRLLKPVPNSPYFRYNDSNFLPYDVVIVDEASMVDLALMSKLISAIREDGRLILLGDKNQLASVEAGAILGDICGKKQPDSYSNGFCLEYDKVAGERLNEINTDSSDDSLNDCIVELHKNYRFADDSGIGIISKYVSSGDIKNSITVLKENKYKDIELSPLPPPSAMAKNLKEIVLTEYKEYLLQTDPVKALELFEQFRVLCVLRAGPYGVNELNSQIEKILLSEKLIEKNSAWYSGRPVMITKNDYNLKLYNGDIGLILPDDNSGGELRAYFLDSEGLLRKIPRVRLGLHETVYAMTVHKSQGSEFNRVLLVLPDRETPLLTRELIYTAMTRAKQKVDILGSENVLFTGISSRIERTSGLAETLWD